MCNYFCIQVTYLSHYFMVYLSNGLYNSIRFIKLVSKGE